MTPDLCPICHTAAFVRGTGMFDSYHVECSRCSKYEISGSATPGADALPKDKRGMASAWLVHNSPKIFDSEHLQIVQGDLRQPSLGRRALAGLRYLSKRFPQGTFFSIGDLVNGDDVGFIPHSWSKDVAEALFILNEYLIDELEYVRQSAGSSNLQISPKGWLALEGQSNAVSSIGFVAMWFSAKTQRLFDEVIAPAIRDAGYESLRIDSKEHNNKIDDEIVASIRSARFVVADYTGERGGVYYEAGFAHGLGLPVVFMAREGTAIHFDTRQYNTIFWKAEDFADARERLKNRILATLGRGPKNQTG